MVRVATVSIALGLVVMILSVAIVTGFRQEIEAKLVGYGSHLQIKNFDSNESYETTPISNQQPFLEELRRLDGVAHIQQFAIKGGIISTPTDNEGVLLRGVTSDFDWAFFNSSLVEGHTPTYSDTTTSNDAIISSRLCRLLKLQLGDRLDVYFVQDPPRARKLTIVGIYDTQLQEVDERLVLCDMRHIQKINGWRSDQISGFEVRIDDIGRLDEMEEKLDELVMYTLREDDEMLRVESIKSTFYHLFSWLNLLDTNVWIILSLMLTVSGFNMISGLLIMVLEKASMIGVLKAIGMRGWQLQKVFIYRSAFIIVKGMLIGNVVGIGLALVQKYTKLVVLDPENYFVSFVPINLSPLAIVLLNVGSFVVILTALTIPSLVIATITPEKSIKME